MINMLKAAKAAKTQITCLTTQQKNAALEAMADSLIASCQQILEANALDLEAAKGTVSDVMLDRLQLTAQRIEGMAKGIRDVAKLPDPVGTVLEESTRADGLLIQKTAVPMGVIAIIYESRPNVTSDAAALALKSGNVCERQATAKGGERLGFGFAFGAGAAELPPAGSGDPVAALQCQQRVASRIKIVIEVDTHSVCLPIPFDIGTLNVQHLRVRAARFRPVQRNVYAVGIDLRHNDNGA